MGNNQRILVIDDDPEMLALCKRLLEGKGYNTMTNVGCDNLLEIVEEFTPHLIFMDHNMPHLCGAEATQLLKSRNNFKNIPVILFSAEPDIEELAHNAGADGWLKKPFKFQNMIEVAQKMALPA